MQETNGSISWTKPQSKIPIVLFTGFYPSEVAQYQRVRIFKKLILFNKSVKYFCSKRTSRRWVAL